MIALIWNVFVLIEIFSLQTISENDDFAVDNLDSQISDVIPHRIRLRGVSILKVEGTKEWITESIKE